MFIVIIPLASFLIQVVLCFSYAKHIGCFSDSEKGAGGNFIISVVANVLTSLEVL